jgi:hypothetical protein
VSEPMEQERTSGPTPQPDAAGASNASARRPETTEPGEYSNFAGNPWAMPMTRDMHEAHERGIGLLRSENMGDNDTKRSELVRAAMPDSLQISSTKAGEELHSRNTREGVHGAWSSQDRLSQAEAVEKHALAWTGKVGEGASERAATRDEQHKHVTDWVSVPGAKRIHSIAAPQMHPDGSLLAGGGRQIWHPGAGGHGRNSKAAWGGLGAEEIKKGTVANRVAGYEGVSAVRKQPIWKSTMKRG